MSKIAISSFPQFFLLKSENCIPICQYLFAAELEEAKIGMWVKGL